MKRFISRASFAVSIAFLCAIPLGIAAEVSNRIVMPDRWEIAFFFYAWVFAIVHHLSKPPRAVNPPAANPDDTLESN